MAALETAVTVGVLVIAVLAGAAFIVWKVISSGPDPFP